MRIPFLHVVVVLAVTAAACNETDLLNKRSRNGGEDGGEFSLTGCVAQEPATGMWMNRAEIGTLPTTGSDFEKVYSYAASSVGSPTLSDQDSNNNVNILAKALVYARCAESARRTEVVNAIRAITNNNTESGGRTLALGRELVAYIIAADLINLPAADSSLNNAFKNKLIQLRTKNLDGDTLVSTHETRPNNWGTHAGASRTAIAIYVGDSAELQRNADVFYGWLGNRSKYSGFDYNADLSWSSVPSAPVPVNPKGATKSGRNIDGALPEEMRRGCSFTWPPCKTGYAWEALQGVVVQAELLARRGYDVYNWQDQAIRRAAQFLYDISWPAEGNDAWQTYLINYAYGTNFQATTSQGNPGKNLGFTYWTHKGRRFGGTVPTPTASATPTQTPTPPPNATPTRTPTPGANPTPTSTPVPGPGGTFTYMPTADAQTSSSSPGSNYGSIAAFRIRDGDPEYRVYLKFNVTTKPANVTSAKIRMYVTEGSRTGGTVHRVADTSWSESTISASNVPAHSSTVLGSEGEIATGQYAEYDVQAAITATGTYSFVLLHDSTDSLYFSSREGDVSPQLIITGN